VKDAVRRLSRNEHGLWLWVPAFARVRGDDGNKKAGVVAGFLVVIQSAIRICA
jgi:hypothetical protein